LKQVLINLISNAIKFTDAGRITIHATMKPGTSRLRQIDVSDTGIGIPRDQLEGIFEPFQRATTGVDPRSVGTGLGLSISKALCKLMGIELGVKSKEGVGTTFFLSMP
jgi:signal transduction histidine kinase